MLPNLIYATPAPGIEAVPRMVVGGAPDGVKPIARPGALLAQNLQVTQHHACEGECQEEAKHICDGGENGA